MVASSQVKRREALLNEYKGNLYEFLVASQIARQRQIESAFMKGIPSDFYAMLGQQEGFIREFYPELLRDLPQLAQGLGKQIQERFEGELIELRIMGKSAAGEANTEYGEGDILGVFSDGSTVPVSVKLSKTGAFVNTKSAGVKSFLSKYFGSFEPCASLQEKLTKEFDREFETMAYTLHEKAGVEFDLGFQNWVDAGFSQLPGELPSDLRPIFLDSLYRVNNMLFESLQSLACQDQEKFIASVWPLLGYTRMDIVQATTFYKSATHGYALDFHSVESAKHVNGKLRFIELRNRDNSASFDVVFEDRILQVRLKAMNKFTGKGFKVNCAVKVLS